MSKHIRKSTSNRYASRRYRKDRIRKKIHGTSECPRMNVFRSYKHFTIQLIDDDEGRTILQRSTMEKELRGKIRSNIEGAKKIGKLMAESALKKNIKKVVFDRNGYKYHGTIKALADSAREAGLVL